jgi:GNAT superfamily N-acetyltransferase
MDVRRAVPADGPGYLRLVRALAEFERLPPPDDAACERLLGDAFSDPPRYELWVAELEPGTVIAYAVTFMTYSTFLARPTLYLEDLFVAPDARHRGVATAMMRFLKDRAGERGCGRFEWMVLEWNRGAQDLYVRLGADMKADWRLMRIDL